MRKIVDCHCHVYPEKIALKASRAIGSFYDAPMRYDGRVETVIKASAGAGISKCIRFSVATKPSQTESINRFIASTVEKSPELFVGLGTLHPDSESLEEDIAGIIALGLRGVKLHPDIQGFKADDYRCLRIYELCEKNRLPVLIHCGDNRFDMDNPNRIRPILDIYTNLTVIGAHLGGYTVWEEAVKAFKDCPNFYTDCSSSLSFMEPDRARDIIREYGANKVLFGTDFPMWDASEELSRLYSLGLDGGELELILYKNASRLFGLGLE